MDTFLPISATTAEPDPSDARTRHGLLAGGTFLMPAEEARAAVDRAAEWNSSLKPYNAFEVYLVDQMAANSIRIQGCQHQEHGLRSRNAIRAKLRWDEDRGLAAEEMGAKLSRDPARFARRLQATLQGCDWMIDRWSRLGRILEAKGIWNEAQTALALDLLGVPKDLRDEPNPLEGAADDRREVVRVEVQRLECLKSKGLDVLDGHERDAAESGFGPDPDGDLAAIRRFERTCSRRFEWARGQLKAGRHGYPPDGPTSPWAGPRPDTAPTATAPPRQTEEQLREQARAALAPGAECPAAATAAVAPAPAAPPAPPEQAAVGGPGATRPADLLRKLYTLAVPTVNRHSRRSQAAHGRRNG